MPQTDLKQTIQSRLSQFQAGRVSENSLALLNTIGYQSDKTHTLDDNTPQAFLETFDPDDRLNADKALLNKWRTADLLFQLTDEELSLANPETVGIRKDFDPKIYQSYLFIAIELEDEAYSRTKLVSITREVNKLFAMPVMLFFKSVNRLTAAIINRRPNKQETSKDVLEKVTLIKDINFENPHRAHLEILYGLSLPQLQHRHKISNFLDLHEAWQKTLDTSELNKKFYREIADWYFWAMREVKFPDDAEKDPEISNATSLIRLITRLIFAWFLKEKGLVPQRLFDETEIYKLLNKTDKTGSAYYKAILQNLFFATLNTAMNRDKAGSRKFVNGQYMVHTLYRYKRYFNKPDEAIKLFEDIPFLNGGLFECLDRKDDDGNEIRIDCFSENAKHETGLKVPDELFFGAEQTVDLSAVFGDKRRAKEKVRGIIRILDSYKFTVAENTPLEEEVALDPELLGKVFENLLASYNPETKTTARKQTGSFYTPREIVNYMVDESLIAYLETRLVEYHEKQTTFGAVTPPSQKEMFGKDKPQQIKLAEKKIKLSDEQKHELNQRLRQLFAYTDGTNPFPEAETDELIRAIDACKILDPACGSGAFPMGILHRLVYLLGKLDPNNRRWREVQKARAIKETEEAYNLGDRDERHRRLAEIEETFDFNSSDYGRKLHLIENCIYGVDIQPIACQIAKLRFFISLVVEQEENRSRPNLGIRPLPNLETRFVAANTLIGLDKGVSTRKGTVGIGFLKNVEIEKLELKLAEARHRHFSAKTYKTKNKWRDKDKELREKIAQLLQGDGWPAVAAEQVAGWNPYDQNASADFFDMEWMFGIREGFDVVIGNPPYVRQEQIKELKPDLKQQFQCYTGVADLYVYFYERGFRLLRQNGVLSYISSNKYFRAGYGKKLRDYFGKHAAIRQIIDFGDAPVFEATAYPSIVVLQNAVANDRQTRALNWHPGTPIAEFDRVFGRQSFFISQKEFTADGWRLESSEVLRLLKKLRATGTPLGEYVNGRFYYGIKTGLNKAFVVDRAIRDRLIAEHPSSAEVLKPFLRGRDVKRWRVEFAEQYLIFTRRGIDIEKYPAIKKHLLQFKSDLMPGVKGGRKPGSYKWFEIQDNIAYWREFEQPKIIIPAITNRVEYAPDTQGFYSNDKTSICVADDVSFLLALLNSRLMWWFIQQTASTRQNGFYEFKPMYVSACPILTGKEAPRIGGLAEKVVATKQQNSTADTHALENQIDLLVYKLYGLTWAEVKIVDPAFAMSEAEYEAVQV